MFFINILRGIGIRENHSVKTEKISLCSVFLKKSLVFHNTVLGMAKENWT